MDAALTTLRRWVDAGGTWRPVAVGDGVATVSLCRCDDPEELELVTSTEAGFVAAVRRPDSLLAAARRDT